jgi:amino acid transporter
MFPILYVGAKYWRRTPTVKVSEMDFYTGLAEIEAETYDEPPPRNKAEAFWQWLVSDRIEPLYASAHLLHK